MNKIPESIIKLNDICYQNNLNLVLAGGALRDTDHGRTPKDFDFFVINNGSFNPKILDTIKASDFEIRKVCGKGFIEKDRQGRKRNSITIELFDGENTIDICYGNDMSNKNSFNTMRDVLNSFDFNINQYALDLNSNNDLCLFDKKSISVIDPKVSKKRIDKIKKQYSEYPFNNIFADKYKSVFNIR